MARYSPSIQNLIAKLGSLPGIGGKSAQKLAFHILDMSDEDTRSLLDAISEARNLTKKCSVCYNFTDSNPCPICSDPQRDKSVLLVVESPKDVATFERMHEYKGLYHVLHGVFDPIKSRSLEDTTIAQLIDRLGKHPEIKEVIVATNQTAEGNATALFLSRMLKPSGIKVSRIASGLPMGSDIEYADDLTLASALKGRVTLTDEA